jgi:tungstate transport system substrate-binding protein
MHRLLLALLLLPLLPVANLGAAPAQPLLRLATTTSTDNSGLLGYLLPSFEQASGYKVHVIAVGTGKALRMGRDGDVDVLLVHAPGAEQQFIDEGFDEQRIAVMYNDFVIVGPADDPAGLRNAANIGEAMTQLHTSKAVFVSRGDDSGTHKKERGLWQAAGILPDSLHYRSAGQGMGKVLQMAGELEAYTLTDRGTWIAYEDKSPLKIAFQHAAALQNPYSIIAITPKRHHDTNYAGAMALVKWIISPQAQQLIKDFRINDKSLFIPSADPDQQRVLGQ